MLTGRGAAGGGYSLEREIERLKRPDGRALLPWVLMAFAPAADILHQRATPPVVAGAGLAVHVALYVATALSAFRPGTKEGPLPRRLLAALAVVTYALAIAFGHNFDMLFILLSLACGALLRGLRFGQVMMALGASAGLVAALRGADTWDAVSTGYSTMLSGLVTAAILTLHDAVSQLRATRQELARTAVSQERLRFSRDLHDLLGHTMSVVVVKAEAVRRLAPRDLDAALAQAADIESVGRQALTEIREAVSGYRECSLATELDRARSALDASGITPRVRESGPPVPPQTEALLGWVVREGVTNVVRHSGAGSCVITVDTGGDRARLEITDDGDGSGAGGGSGTGLTGLTERLAMAGGSLRAGPDARRGFRLVAELPVEEPAVAVDPG
ncbi:two-component system sensor kinase [Streptantibioticus cattleyicolor NRRL 8057 = DSM 46488]|uniref:Two-component system sensor kinase n=1 Tax=Streptantibioticus cattleyicolor (strain ATCC 35852 / DSM 46488 / JCM 4925 / NBRC 14057 / NRRL 8057) TaxID=1003195 RepID=G8WWB3_STREN|nr:two-component system sensor kinase [Streptantibioticus cattleyicolor NRRL 8057 = DSM 46488]